jgi:flagellar biosynthesis protein
MSVPTEPAPTPPSDETRRRVAVALDYEAGHPGAPKVVATGRGALADAILEVAFANGVKVREDADLAELLGAVELGHEIPVEAFAAVAEVLAYVYRANRLALAEDFS